MKTLIKILAAFTLLNASSFAGVGMKKAASLTSTEAAVMDEIGYGREFFPTDLLYGFGTRFGHKVFYDQEDHHKTARDYLRSQGID